MRQQWKESVVVPIRESGNETIVITEKCHTHELHTRICSLFLPILTPYVDEFITGDFDVIDQILMSYSTFARYWKKKWKYNGRVHLYL